MSGLTDVRSIYVVAPFLGGTGLGVWAIVWCVLNIACLAAVLFGLAKNNMQFLFPALSYSIAIILVGLINVVVNFIQLAWFAAIWLLAIFALTRVLRLGPGYSAERRRRGHNCPTCAGGASSFWGTAECS